MDNLNTKSFWDKQEGTTGKLIIAGSVIGGGILIYNILPMIITMLQGLITAIGLSIVAGVGAAILFAAWMFFSNPAVQAAISAKFQAMSSAVTHAMVESDPIGIMKALMKKFKKKKVSFDEGIEELNSSNKQTEAEIERNEEERQDCLRLVKRASGSTSLQSKTVLQVQSHQAALLENTNKQLQKVLNVNVTMLKALRNMRLICDANIQQMEATIRVETNKDKALRGASKARKFAKDIIGDSSDKQLFDESVEVANERFEKELGIIEEFSENISGLIESAKLSNEADEDRALEQIMNWDRKATDIAGQKVRVESESLPIQNNNANDFDDLFTSKTTKV